MNDQAIQSLSAAATLLMDHVSALAPGARKLADECRKARDDAVKILTPTSSSGDTSPLAAEARAALASTTGLNDRLVALNVKADAILKVFAGAMNETSYVANDLVSIEEAGGGQSPEDRQNLVRYSRLHRFTQAEWGLDAGTAVLQVHSVLIAYDELLLAYLDGKPGQRLNLAGAAKEVANKVHDAIKDGLTFPGYSKFEKLFRALMKSPVEKEIEALRGATASSAKISRLNAGLDVLGKAIDAADEVVRNAGQSLLASIDELEESSKALLESLRKSPADPPRGA